MLIKFYEGSLEERIEEILGMSLEEAEAEAEARGVDKSYPLNYAIGFIQGHEIGEIERKRELVLRHYYFMKESPEQIAYSLDLFPMDVDEVLEEARLYRR